MQREIHTLANPVIHILNPSVLVVLRVGIADKVEKALDLAILGHFVLVLVSIVFYWEFFYTFG